MEYTKFATIGTIIEIYSANNVFLKEDTIVRETKTMCMTADGKKFKKENCGCLFRVAKTNNPLKEFGEKYFIKETEEGYTNFGIRHIK